MKYLTYKKHSTTNLFSIVILKTIAVMLILGFTACTVQKEDGEHLFEEQMAPLLDGMSDYHYKISTDDTLAQNFFNQGLVLSYGFNHKEANRTFR